MHEAWLRVSDGDNEWDNRGQFFAAAAEAMRRILMGYAHRKKPPKHGGNKARVNVDGVDVVANYDDDELIAIHETLGELEKEDPIIPELVKLRCFADVTVGKTALALDISRSTAKRNWNHARA